MKKYNKNFEKKIHIYIYIYKRSNNMHNEVISLKKLV